MTTGNNDCPPRILVANQISTLGTERKLEIGKLVSQALSEHSDTMLQYTGREVSDIMDEGRAVLALHPKTEELDGFAQLSPWYTENDKNGIGAIEFRGWLSRRAGVGPHILRGAVALSLQKYPETRVYAIIEQGNAKAQQVVLDTGGIEVPRPDAIKIELKAGDDPAAVKTYDLTDLPV